MHDPTALFKFEGMSLPADAGHEESQRQEGRRRRAATHASQPLHQRTDRGAGRRPHRYGSAGAPRRARSCAAPAAPAACASDHRAQEDAGSFAVAGPDNRILGAILDLRRAEPTTRWCSSPRTSTCASRRRSRGLAARTTRTTARSMIQPALHRRHRAAGGFLAAAWQGPEVLDRKGPHLLRAAPQRRGRLVSQPVPVPARRRGCRAARGESGRRPRHAADRRRLPQPPACGVGHRGAQPRTELRAERADGPGDRFRHPARTAGTGKTLLALAAGLAQTMDAQRYREIIMTRATISVGEDIGFLPGTEEEKIRRGWVPLTDNLEVLMPHNKEGGSWGRAATTTCWRRASRSAR